MEDAGVLPSSYPVVSALSQTGYNGALQFACLPPGVTPKRLHEVLTARYQDEPVVRVMSQDSVINLEAGFLIHEVAMGPTEWIYSSLSMRSGAV